MEDVFTADEGNRKNEFQRLDAEIAEFKSKLVKTDDLFIPGDLEKDSHKRMKDHYQHELWALQEHKKDLNVMDSSFNQYMKWGFSLLINLPEYYQNATLEIKQKMISSIFPEKLIFANGTYRTNRTNEVLSLLCSNDKGFSEKENGQEVNFNYLSIQAPRAGLELF